MIAARARVGVALFMCVKETLRLSRGFEPRGDDVGLRRIYRDREVPMTGAARVSRPSPSRKTARTFAATLWVGMLVTLGAAVLDGRLAVSHRDTAA